MGFFNNSLSRSGQGPAYVEEGVVADINIRNFTVDWVSNYSDKKIFDIQWASPYLHPYNGEGIFVMPEIGSVCFVTFPSDGSPPFVSAFVAPMEAEGKPEAEDLSASVGEEDPEEIDTLPSTRSTGEPSEGSNNAPDASFRAGRPRINPGDIMLRTRDENFVALRRGGVVEIGATSIAQRIYIPIRNLIRDVCENYAMDSLSGSIKWEVMRQEEDPDGNAPTEFEYITREFAQDAKASIKFRSGNLGSGDNVDDKMYHELIIAPSSIDPTTGQVDNGSEQYIFRIDKSGNSFVLQAGIRKETIKSNLDQTVEGTRDLTVTQNNTETYQANFSASITGTHELSGNSTSKESWVGAKTIEALILRLGSQGASQPALLGLNLLQWLITHVHPPYLPPITPFPPNALSTKIFLE